MRSYANLLLMLFIPACARETLNDWLPASATHSDSSTHGGRQIVEANAGEDATYSVATVHAVPGIKRSLDVRLSKKVSKEACKR